MIPWLVLGALVAAAACGLVAGLELAESVRIERGMHYPRGPVGWWRRIRGTFGDLPGCDDCRKGDHHAA